MKIRKAGEKFFADEYKERVLEKGHNEKHLIGDISKEIQKEYTNQLNDIIAKHKSIEGVYYIYAVHSKNPQFPTAHNICFCTMKEKDLFKAKMLPSTDLWQVDNTKGDLKLLWCIPPKGKIPRILDKPVDKKTYEWTKQALRGMNGKSGN